MREGDNDEVMATGALVTGRTTFVPAGGDHHNGQHAEGAKDLKEMLTFYRP
jgi:hypothetical protein